MMGSHAKRAMQAMHEKALAAKHQEGEQRHCTGERACAGWITRLTRPGNRVQSIDAQAKFLIRAAACGALWTRDRADAAGYLLGSVQCPLCMIAMDSMPSFDRPTDIKPESREKNV